YQMIRDRDSFYWVYTPLVDGIYEYWIVANDTSGNSAIAQDADGEYDADAPFWFVASSYTWDIGVDGLVNLTDGGRINTVPRYIEAVLHNYGIGSYRDMDVDVHLQIYEEVPVVPEDYVCWDMEQCHLNTFLVEDGNGDGVSWYWTEKRSFSPTHSFHSQPDYLDTYEAYSEDYLGTQDWIHIPTEKAMDSSAPTIGAWINFTHWCMGEYASGIYYDYGQVFIEDALNPGVKVPVSTPFYTTYNPTTGSYEWWWGDDNYEGKGDYGIDISAYIGHDIKIWFGWFADGTVNYEGWYIDDICIKLAYGSLQPLIFQGYKFTDVLGPYCTQWIIQFPIEWQPKNDTYYFIEVYVTNSWDENPLNDRVNYTIYFGDVCDAAVWDVDVDPEFEMPDTTDVPGADWVNVPIDVTVYNNGTLTEEIPVRLSIQPKITEVIFKDDMESGDLGWTTMAVVGNDLEEDHWKMTSKDFASPFHSWYFEPAEMVSIGQAKIWQPIDPFVKGGLQWTANIKYNLPTDSGFGMTPIFLGKNYYWDLSLLAGREPPYKGNSGGWEGFDADKLLRDNYLYWEQIPQYWDLVINHHRPQSLGTLLEALNNAYGPPGMNLEDFSQLEFGFLVEAPTGLESDHFVYFDDFKLFHQYPGETIWSEINTTYLSAPGGVAPGDIAHVGFVWNTTEYCEYYTTAEIILDCDQDPYNNILRSETQIYEDLYFNDYENVTTEDNTYGLPDDWHIVEECSACPADHFWWSGNDEEISYLEDADDVLEMLPYYEYDTDGITKLNEDFVDIENGTFDFTAPGYYNLTFDAWWSIEMWWDYCLLEISNDSGLNWYP
ncbi:hypothetical protein DRN98_07570, partial [Methanosarcinales archaeon]